MRRSIGLRLTLWYTGLLAATLFFLGGSAYFLLGYSLQREVDVALASVGLSFEVTCHTLCT